MNKSFNFLVVGIIVLTFVLVIGSCSSHIILGVGAFGPKNTEIITITRCYVDISGSGKKSQSHYMVGTDKGTFEVNNGLMLGVWNADDIYSKLREGKRYEITTKGNRVVNIFMQEYPYIIGAKEL